MWLDFTTRTTNNQYIFILWCVCVYWYVLTCISLCIEDEYHIEIKEEEEEGEDGKK